MTGRASRSRQGSGRLRVAIVGLLGALIVATATPGPPALAAGNLPAWTGGVNLYRAGVFTTQASWLYCTAAGSQIIRNMVDGTDDHSAEAQTTYFDWMRARNEYDLPLSAGIDPAGWTAGLRHFVDDRYRLGSSASFDDALRPAVARIRWTNLPVALTVSHGNHGWVLHGFTATADPAATSDFEITTVRVTGPLWGLQSRNGYDMRPNTELTIDQLRTFFTPWRYDPLPMIWDGTFVSIQPVPDAAEAPTGSPTPPAAPTLGVTQVESANPSPTQERPSASPPSMAVVPPSGAAPASTAGPAVPGALGPAGASASAPSPSPTEIGLLVAFAIVIALAARAATSRLRTRS